MFSIFPACGRPHRAISTTTPGLPYDAETWTSGSSTWNIESREQVRDKVQLALDRNMAGVMYWTLHYDAPGELGLHRVAYHKIVFERDIPDILKWAPGHATRESPASVGMNT